MRESLGARRPVGHLSNVSYQGHEGRGPGIGGYESMKIWLRLNQHKFVPCVRQGEGREEMQTENKNTRWENEIKSDNIN